MASRQLLTIFAACSIIIMLAVDVNAKASFTISNVSGTDVNFECHRGSKYLGLITLHDQQRWTYKFHRDVFGNTLYTCYFKWFAPDNKIYTKAIPGWKSSPYAGDTHCSQCLWAVDSRGFQLWNKDGKNWVQCYTWDQSAESHLTAIAEKGH